MVRNTEIVKALCVLTGSIDGGVIYIHAGDLIEADHPAVKKWPHCFGPIELRHPVKREPPVEQATAAPGEKRTWKRGSS